MISLKEWQEGIRKYAKEKGFNWTKADIDTMLLRIISELCEAAEAARDIPIQKKIKLEITVINNDFPAGMILGTDVVIDVNDGKFEKEYDGLLWRNRPLKVYVKGQVIEEFEPDEHVAEELADVFIRLADMCEVLGIDLEAEAWKKHKRNVERPPKHGRERK